MACRPEPRRARAGAVAILAAALAASGCGKADLPDSGGATTKTATAASTQAARTPPPAPAPAPAPRAPKTHTAPRQHRVSAARAAAFARAVTLSTADVPGSRAAHRSATPTAREHEAAGCGGRTTPTIGEGRSSELQRGRGLDRESVSSSVQVLRDTRSAERDLRGAQSASGLRCYERVLRRSLHEETDPNVKLLGVRVAPLHVTVDGAGQARGIRILARVSVPGAGVVLRLFVDALSIPYGPAEIDLFATSFVQPMAVRTEQELLALLHERARRHPL